MPVLLKGCTAERDCAQHEMDTVYRAECKMQRIPLPTRISYHGCALRTARLSEFPRTRPHPCVVAAHHILQAQSDALGAPPRAKSSGAVSEASSDTWTRNHRTANASCAHFFHSDPRADHRPGPALHQSFYYSPDTYTRRKPRLFGAGIFNPPAPFEGLAHRTRKCNADHYPTPGRCCGLLLPHEE